MGDHSFNNPWGLGTIFEETVWSVTIDPGGQAELLGIETGDIIVARNHEVIDDHNRTAIQEQLMAGTACKIAFLKKNKSPVTEWLNSLGLYKYATEFEEEGIVNLDVIKNLSEEEINEMIDLVGFTPREG